MFEASLTQVGIRQFDYEILRCIRLCFRTNEPPLSCLVASEQLNYYFACISPVVISKKINKGGSPP